MYTGLLKYPNSLRTETVIVSAAGQSIFNNLNYNPASVAVYLDGIKLVPGTQYTAADGNNITLVNPAAIGAKLDIISNDDVIDNAVTSVAGKSGNVTLYTEDVIGAAPLNSPTFTGNPTAPTPTPGDNDTSIATTAFVQSALSAFSSSVDEDLIAIANLSGTGFLKRTGPNTWSLDTSTYAYTNGSNATGTWPISITGNAAYAVNSTNSTTANTAYYLVTTSNYQVRSFGVGTAPSSTQGVILATNDIIAFYSDKRLKDIKGTIPNALSKVESLNGIIYTNNELAKSFGYTDTEEKVGLIAQEVEAVLPQLVTLAPFDRQEEADGTVISKSGENFKTVQYDKVIALLVEAVKELSAKVKELEAK